MKAKTIVGIVLLVFAAGSLAYLVATEAFKEDESARRRRPLTPVSRLQRCALLTRSPLLRQRACSGRA